MDVNKYYIGYVINQNTIQITPEILGLIAKIDEFKGAWRALGTLAPNRLSALRRVAAIDSIGASCRMAGGKLSDREVERLLSNPQIKAFTTQDEQEAAGYAEVMNWMSLCWQNISLSENHLKQLHRDLLIYSEKDAAQRGNYRTLPNPAGLVDERGVGINGASETATSRLMVELVTWMEGERRLERLHPLLLIGLWMVSFLNIHPFQDGNARLSRILTTLLLLQAGYPYVPYSSLESVFESDQEAYFLALAQTQATIPSDAPDWQPWLLFFLRALAEQVRRLNTKLERERLVLAPLPTLSLQLVEFAREHGRLTMSDALRLTGGNRNTLKQHFRTLVKQGCLNQNGAGRGVWYELR